jgi:3',5'-cyclic AMP phosphodiesterase CpdA
MPNGSAPRDAFLIAQLSDLHAGSPFFDEHLLGVAVEEVRAMRPDLVVVGGDLTTDGYAPEFRTAQRFLKPLFDDELTVLVVPGNHDAKNVGYLHFGDTFGQGDVPGKHDRVMKVGCEFLHEDPMEFLVVGMDSTKPDLAEGEIGRERYDWLRQQFMAHTDDRIFVLHHHLVPVPGTGRERNTVWDAGDVLTLLSALDVHLVLSGHKHVPFVWLLNDLLIVNSGTVSSHRLRGYVRPSYNVIEMNRDVIRVTLKFPGTGERFAAELDRTTMRLRRGEEFAGMFAKSAWLA